jgi:signal transduction histidine kinase
LSAHSPYEDILIKNQKQSAEYSKLLHSEIQIQTSELKNSNKELKLAKKKAEAANLAKDAFLANMSHEIRTPLNSVLGFLELSLEGPSIQNDLQQHLSIAYNSAKGLLSLIDDILNVSKLEKGKVVLEKKPFRLLELIKKTFDTMKIEAKKKGIILEYDILG